MFITDFNLPGAQGGVSLLGKAQFCHILLALYKPHQPLHQEVCLVIGFLSVLFLHTERSQNMFWSLGNDLSQIIIKIFYYSAANYPTKNILQGRHWEGEMTHRE